LSNIAAYGAADGGNGGSGGGFGVVSIGITKNTTTKTARPIDAIMSAKSKVFFIVIFSLFLLLLLLSFSCSPHPQSANNSVPSGLKILPSRYS
jgi:hypothetical protein